MFTPNYNLPLLYQNQSMKEIVINETINRLDYLLNRVVQDIVNILPENPTDGDLFIQQDHSLALFINNQWEIIPPKKHMIFYVLARQDFAVFSDKWEIVKRVN